MNDCKEIDCCPEPMDAAAVRYQAGGGEVAQDGVLLNVDFNSTTPTPKVGFSATGITDLDFWNSFAAADDPGPKTLRWSSGGLSAVTLLDSGVAGGTFGDNGNSDPMLASFYEKQVSPWEKTFTLTGLAAGTYDLYLYGFSNQTGANARGNFLLMIDGVQYPNGATFYNTLTNDNPPWVNGNNMVRISGIPITAGQLLQIKAYFAGGTSYGKISGFQLLRSPAPPPPGPALGQAVGTPNSGSEVFFGDGLPITAGQMRVTLLDGAMRYGSDHGFSVNFTDDINKFVITHSGGTEITGPWNCDVSTQAQVAALMNGTYVDFTHTGGPISIRLFDTNYADNIPGSPNPTFALSRLS